jgi:hypothetical protein
MAIFRALFAKNKIPHAKRIETAEPPEACQIFSNP